jgi:hypothetical protein
MKDAEPAFPSHLAELRSRLLRFPDRRDAAKRVDTLRQASVFAADLRAAFARVSERQNYLAVVFADADLTAVTRQQQVVREKAAALLQMIDQSSRPADFDPQKQLTDLGRAVQGADTLIGREWLARIEAIASKYNRLSSALQRAGVTGSADLFNVVGRVRDMSAPPDSEAHARRVKADIESVGPTLARLGLEGGLGSSVGGFLIAVSEGKGNPKLLLDPEVRAFLDRHDLWSVLTVSFG